MASQCVQKGLVDFNIIDQKYNDQFDWVVLWDKTKHERTNYLVMVEVEYLLENFFKHGARDPDVKRRENPEFIEAPNDVGVLIVESNMPERPEYEPFTPSSYYYLSEFDLEISEHGDYYLVVYETYKEGRYGLAVGYREVFGIDEWLLIPIDVLSIREWALALRPNLSIAVSSKSFDSESTVQNFRI